MASISKVNLNGTEYDVGVNVPNLDTATTAEDEYYLTIYDGTSLKKITFVDFVDAIAGSDPGRRNGFYGGRDLTDVYTVDELQEKVSAGDFTGLLVGDYITVSITTSLGGTEEVDLLFGGFDYFLNNGNTALTDHHVIMVPKDCFATTSYMNSSNTTSGGYAGSYMYSTVLPIYATAISSALNGHMLSHYRNLTSGISTSYSSMAGLELTGASSANTWSEETLCLMSEAMVCGCHPNASSARDVADGCMQIPIFALRPDFRIAGQGKDGDAAFWWLSGVTSSTTFSCMFKYGNTTYVSASGSNGVRPYFLFG